MRRMKPIVGDRVTLRPFRRDELDLWVEASRTLGEAVFPGGVPTRAALRSRIAGTRRTEGEIDLAIEVDGRVIGDIQTQQPPAYPLPPGVHQLGIALFRREDRGLGYGTEAVRLFTEWLFRDRGAETVQAGTTPNNAAMRRVFDRLGFEEAEPIMVFGQRHLLYVLTRERWEGRGG
jgi:RimJ/RimL family protein N-acetyltransferase